MWGAAAVFVFRPLAERSEVVSERDLNRAVAAATGETVETIQRLGFRLNDPVDSGLGVEDDFLAAPRALDWDSGVDAALDDILGDDDWPGRIDPLPSYDEQLEDDEDLAETVCAAA
jgi:hypothetical protein